jgi:hypothetical protein
MKKFKITYIQKGYKKRLLEGAVETENAISWFSQNAPQVYKMVGCEVINGEEFDKLENLQKTFNQKI